MQNPAQAVNIAAFGGTPQQFLVGDPSFLIEQLAVETYEDPCLAVAREIITNAWDAHTAAGTLDIPVEVELDKNAITIKDSGTGIPLEKFTEIYCTIGGSTKRDDNTQTGSKGIGSKSPLALSDQYTVTTRYKGQKATYALLKNPRGFPERRIMGTSLTTERDGLTVTVPIKDEKRLRAQLNDAILRTVQGGNLPILLNGERLEPQNSTVYEDDDIEIVSYPDYRSSWSKVMVKYGRIIYPLNLGKFASDISSLPDLSIILPGTHKHTYLLKAPPGSLRITTSREDIVYGKNEVDILRALLKRAHSRLTAAALRNRRNHYQIHQYKHWTDLARILTGKAHNEYQIKNDPHLFPVTSPQSLDFITTAHDIQKWSRQGNIQLGRLSTIDLGPDLNRIKQLYSTSPHRYHARRLWKALGPLTNDIRVQHAEPGSSDAFQRHMLAPPASRRSLYQNDSKRAADAAASPKYQLIAITSRARHLIIARSLAEATEEQIAQLIPNAFILVRKSSNATLIDAAIPVLRRLQYTVIEQELKQPSQPVSRPETRSSRKETTFTYRDPGKPTSPPVKSTIRPSAWLLTDHPDAWKESRYVKNEPALNPMKWLNLRLGPTSSAWNSQGTSTLVTQGIPHAYGLLLDQFINLRKHNSPALIGNAIVIARELKKSSHLFSSSHSWTTNYVLNKLTPYILMWPDHLIPLLSAETGIEITPENIPDRDIIYDIYRTIQIPVPKQCKEAFDPAEIAELTPARKTWATTIIEINTVLEKLRTELTQSQSHAEASFRTLIDTAFSDPNAGIKTPKLLSLITLLSNEIPTKTIDSPDERNTEFEHVVSLFTLCRSFHVPRDDDATSNRQEPLSGA